MHRQLQRQPHPPAVKLDASSINVKLTLTDMRLADVLDAIVLAADHPIQYSILDDGIVFSTRDSNSAPLETRTFKVDAKIPASFTEANRPSNQRRCRHETASLKRRCGFVTAKAIFYNDRMGMLFVRATEQDLDTVEKQ